MRNIDSEKFLKWLERRINIIKTEQAKCKIGDIKYPFRYVALGGKIRALNEMKDYVNFHKIECLDNDR